MEALECINQLSQISKPKEAPTELLEQAFDLRQDEAHAEAAKQALAAVFANEIKVPPEQLGEAFVLLAKSIEQFDIEKSPTGVNGFIPYFLFRLKHHLKDESTKETAKTRVGAPVSHFKKHRKFEREDARHYAETGEHLDEHAEAFDENYKGISHVDRFERSFGEDGGTVGDLVGREDDNWESDEFYALFDEDEKWLIEELAVNGTQMKDICLELYGNDSDPARNSVKKLLAVIKDKIVNYYGDDCVLETIIKKGLEQAESKYSPTPFLAAEVQKKVGKGKGKKDFLSRKPCRACETEFRPIHKAHQFCSEKCCRSHAGGIMPKDLTKEWLVAELREKTFGQIAFETDRWTYRIQEWAWYYGIRRREQVLDGSCGTAVKYPQNLPGFPSRATVAKSIPNTSLEDMRTKWGLKHDKGLLKLISWYGLEGVYQQRNRIVFSKEARKDLKIRTARMAKGNKRVIEARLARGWDPLVPEPPTKEALLEVLLTHTWAEMADHFQLSERCLMDLAKKYKIKQLRPRMIFSKEGAKRSAEGLKKALQQDAIKRGRKIPSKEELAKDLKTLTWNEIVDKWEWSKPWLVKRAKEYGIYDLKTRKEAASERQADLKWPFPSKEEYAEMLKTQRLYQLSTPLHRTETVLRKKAVKMGLRHLLVEHHAPSKQALNKKLKKCTLAETAKFYGFTQSDIRKLIDEYDIDIKTCRAECRKYKKKQAEKEKAKPKNKKELFIESLPTKEEVEKMLETPALSSTKLAEMMGCNVKTARHHVEKRLGLIWPTNRSIHREEIERDDPIFDDPDLIVERHEFIAKVRELGMFYARRYFELNKEQMDALMRIYGITPKGYSVGLYSIRDLTNEQLETLLRGRDFAYIEKRYGIPPELIKTTLLNRGMDDHNVRGRPFDEEVAIYLMQSMTKEELAEYFDADPSSFDSWLLNMNQELNLKPLRRSIIEESIKCGSMKKAFDHMGRKTNSLK